MKKYLAILALGSMTFLGGCQENAVIQPEIKIESHLCKRYTVVNGVFGICGLEMRYERNEKHTGWICWQNPCHYDSLGNKYDY